jgi:hypothetical protein
MGKWLTVALFVGAISYSVINKEPNMMMNPHQEEVRSIDSVVKNPRELVTL